MHALVIALMKAMYLKARCIIHHLYVQGPVHTASGLVVDLHHCLVPNWVLVMISAINKLPKVLEIGTLIPLTHLPYSDYCVKDMRCELSLYHCSDTI